MNNETEERVPVALALRTSAIDRLISERQSRSVMALARMDSSELQAIPREDYQQALDGDLITFVNLTIRILGTFDDADKKIKYSQNGAGLNIKAVYDCGTKTTEVYVNDMVVCSNVTPRQEIFVAGNWLRQMSDAFNDAEAKAESRDRLNRQAEKESLILDLSADV